MSAAEPKVCREVAETEFERFADAMDLDLDKSAMDDEDRKSFDETKTRVIKAMMRGHLEVNPDGEMVYTPQVGDNREPIVFREPRGADLMAMDSKKKHHDMAKVNAFMAGVTQTSEKRFANMRNRDLKICHAIVNLFLGG